MGLATGRMAGDIRASSGAAVEGGALVLTGADGSRIVWSLKERRLVRSGPGGERAWRAGITSMKVTVERMGPARRGSYESRGSMPLRFRPAPQGASPHESGASLSAALVTTRPAVPFVEVTFETESPGGDRRHVCYVGACPRAAEAQ